MEYQIKKTLSDTTDGISSEAAVQAVGNRYDLVLIASQRVRELNRGHSAKMITRNGPMITATQEIAAGLVGRDYLLRGDNRPPRRQRNRG